MAQNSPGNMGMMMSQKNPGNVPVIPPPIGAPIDAPIDGMKIPGLGQIAQLGGLAATGIGLAGTFKKSDEEKQLASSVAARQRAALQGRLGATPEELERQAGTYQEAATGIAGTAGTEAAQQALVGQGMGGVPGGALYGQAQKVQERAVQQATDVAAKGAKNVYEQNLRKIFAEEAALREDKTHLAALGAGRTAKRNELLVRGGIGVIDALTGLPASQAAETPSLIQNFYGAEGEVTI